MGGVMAFCAGLLEARRAEGWVGRGRVPAVELRTAAERGARRDAAALGGVDAARAAFRDRYHAAQRRYLAERDPESSADVVVDVEDPAEPRIVRAPSLHAG